VIWELTESVCDEGGFWLTECEVTIAARQYGRKGFRGGMGEIKWKKRMKNGFLEGK
jgi:uncharacterized protein YdgA (DUF945 family)